MVTGTIFIFPVNRLIVAALKTLKHNKSTEGKNMITSKLFLITALATLLATTAFADDITSPSDRLDIRGEQINGVHITTTCRHVSRINNY